jgi:hypothetical protein
VNFQRKIDRTEERNLRFCCLKSKLQRYCVLSQNCGFIVSLLLDEIYEDLQMNSLNPNQDDKAD